MAVFGAAFLAVIGALIGVEDRQPDRVAVPRDHPRRGLRLGVGGLRGRGRAIIDFPLADIARAFTDPFFLTGLATFVAVFLLFPTGRLASPRWRWVWWAYVVALAVTFFGFLLQPAQPAADGLGGGSAPADAGGNALGVAALGSVIGPALAVAGVTIVLAGFAGLISLVVRFRRGTAEERQQIRWLLAVAILAALTLVAVVVTGTFVEQAEAGERSSNQAMVIANNVVFLLLVASIVIGTPSRPRSRSSAIACTTSTS